MSLDLKNAGLWSVQGARFQRLNPDGTRAKPTRTVGGVGTFDLSGLTASAGDISIIIDTGAQIDLTVDFSAASSISAVTVDEAVTAFSAAITTEPVVVTKEVATGRLKIASTGSNQTYMQVFGELAGYLGIGGCEIGSQLGTKMKGFFDAVTGISREKNVKEGEETETETGDGSLWTITTSTILKGENITYNMVKDDDEFKELVMGGVYNATTFSYAYPNTDQTKSPKFYMESYIPKYEKGYQDRTDLAGYTQIKWVNCTGIEGAVSNEAKSWATLAYNIKALEAKDENGAKVSATTTYSLSQEDVEALNLV